MRGRLQLHHVRARRDRCRTRRGGPEHVGGQALRRRRDASVRGRAADIVAAAGDHTCVDTPGRVQPVRRAVTDTGLYKGFRPAGRQRTTGDRCANPNTSSGATSPARSTPDRRPRGRRGGHRRPAGPPTTSPPSGSGGATGPRRTRPSANSFPQWNQIDSRPPTTMPTGCASSSRSCWPTIPTSRRCRRAEECWSEIQTLMTRRGRSRPAATISTAVAPNLLELRRTADPGVRLRAADRAAAPVRGRAAGTASRSSGRSRTARRCSPPSAANASSCAKTAGAPTMSWPASSTRSTPRSPTRSPTTARCSTAGARLRRAVPSHRRTRAARGLRADDATGDRAGPDAILTLHRWPSRDPRISDQIARVNTGWVPSSSTAARPDPARHPRASGRRCPS